MHTQTHNPVCTQERQLLFMLVNTCQTNFLIN